MGGFSLPQLPQPPQVGQPMQGVHGGLMGGMQGGLAQEPNAFAAILQGLGQAMTSYRAAREHKKDEARKQFDTYMAMSKEGIPVPPEEIAKTAKKAGLKFDWDGPSKEQLQYQENKRAYEEKTKQLQLNSTQNLQGPSQIMPDGGMGPRTQIPTAAQGAPDWASIRKESDPNYLYSMGAQEHLAPPPRSPGTPGLMQRIGMGVGLVGQPPPSPASPMYKQILEMQANGQAQQGLSKLMLDVNKRKLMVFVGALEGNDEAQKMATRMGLFEDPMGIQWAEMLADKMAIPRTKMIERLVDVKFGGAEERQLAFQKWAKEMERDEKGKENYFKAFEHLSKTYKADPLLLHATAGSMVWGKSEDTMKLMNLLASTKTYEAMKGEREERDTVVKERQLQVNIDKQISDYKIAKEQNAIGWKNSGIAQQGVDVRRLEVTNNAVGKMLDSKDAGIKNAIALLASPQGQKLPDDFKKFLAEQIANTANTMGAFKFQTGEGKEMPGAGTGEMTVKDVEGWFNFLPFVDSHTYMPMYKPTNKAQPPAPPGQPGAFVNFMTGGGKSQFQNVVPGGVWSPNQTNNPPNFQRRSVDQGAVQGSAPAVPYAPSPINPYNVAPRTPQSSYAPQAPQAMQQMIPPAPQLPSFASMAGNSQLMAPPIPPMFQMMMPPINPEAYGVKDLSPKKKKKK